MKRFILRAICILCAFAFVAPASSQSQFVELVMDGLSISVPRSWRHLSPEMNTLIETSSEAVLRLRGMETEPGRLLVAANSMPASTYASVRVAAVEPYARPAEIRSLSRSAIEEFNKEMVQELRASLPAQNLTLIEGFGSARETINGNVALATSYKRTGPKGPVLVEIIHIFTEQRVLRVHLAYRESEGTLWKPVIQVIRTSIKAN